jgi:diaminopimelate decarboxylase
MNLPIEKFKDIETPFYYYDRSLLQATLDTIKGCLKEHPDYHLHYAIKANANIEVLREI